MKAALFLLATAGSCAIGVANAQSMFRGDAAHSGVYRAEAPRELHRIKWRFPTGDRIVSSPILKGDVVYFGGDDGGLYALDARTGTVRWLFPTGNPITRASVSLSLSN